MWDLNGLQLNRGENELKNKSEELVSIYQQNTQQASYD